jgi:hypothetical protein
LSGTDIDLSAAGAFSLDLTTDITLTVSNAPSSGTLGSFILEVTNIGAAFTITWWSGIYWLTSASFGVGQPPSLAVSGTTVLEFYTFDGGVTWRGWSLGRYEGGDNTIASLQGVSRIGGVGILTTSHS